MGARARSETKVEGRECEIVEVLLEVILALVAVRAAIQPLASSFLSKKRLNREL